MEEPDDTANPDAKPSPEPARSVHGSPEEPGPGTEGDDRRDDSPKPAERD